MKIKLKNKDNPINKMINFKSRGYCQTTIDTINSGKQVVVEKVPQNAWEYVEEVKKTKTKKESK
tara:strand:- start:444 stop:635 length:192 start_codon:yes stop_codon:yes gene_type:complete